MFGKKSREIEELRRLCSAKDEKIERLNKELEIMDKKFDDFTNVMANRPANCKTGKYCAACEFAKPYFTHTYSIGMRNTHYACNKNGGCPEFVQRERLEK